MKLLIKFLAKLTVTFATLYYVFNNIISNNVDLNFKILNFNSLLILILIVVLSYLLISLRLLIISENKVNFFDLVKINIISSFFSNLNSAGSDLIRILMLKKKVQLISSFTYIFCDRVIGIISKLIFIFMSIIILAKINNLIIFCIFISLLLIFYLLFLKMLPYMFNFVNNLNLFKKYQFQTKIFKSIANLKKFIPLVVICFVCNFLQVAFIYVISIFYDDSIKFIQSLVIGPITMIMSSLPISLGGWGIREITMIHGYNFFDIPSQTALIISITIGVANLLISFFFTTILFAYGFIRDLKKNEK